MGEDQEIKGCLIMDFLQATLHFEQIPGPRHVILSPVLRVINGGILPP
jgi:hypothetical protein